MISSKRKDFQDAYDIQESLRSGTYKVVYRGFHSLTGRPVILKNISKSILNAFPSLRTPSNLAPDIHVLRTLTHHPHIVELLDWWETKSGWMVVSEYVGEPGEAIEQGAQHGEGWTATIVAGLASAIGFLHDRSVILRDLKPSNVVLRDPADPASVVLTDFTCSVVVGNTPSTCLTTGVIGTPIWQAPELLNNEPYGREIDLWSLGMLTLFFLIGSNPLGTNSSSPSDVLKKMSAGVLDNLPNAPNGRPLTAEAVDFIKRLLVRDPLARMHCGEILEHPWIVKRVEPKKLREVTRWWKRAGSQADSNGRISPERDESPAPDAAEAGPEAIQMPPRVLRTARRTRSSGVAAPMRTVDLESAWAPPKWKRKTKVPLVEVTESLF